MTINVHKLAKRIHDNNLNDDQVPFAKLKEIVEETIDELSSEKYSDVLLLLEKKSYI